MGKNTLAKPCLRAAAFFFSLLHLSITLKFKPKTSFVIREILKILIQNYLQEILPLITQLPKNTSGTHGGAPTQILCTPLSLEIMRAAAYCLNQDFQDFED